MKYFLRYSLMMALFLLCGSSYAGTDVKFDFDANGKDLFGLPGESSSDASDGDITEAKTAIIDGVTLTVSQAAEGVSSPNRIWNKSPKLRMYSGLLMITAPAGHNITALTFDQGKWNDKNTADSGTLSSTGWEGNAPVVIISIAANTQFRSITVTIDGEGGDNPDDPNSKSLLQKFDFTSGTITDNGDQTVFEFTGKAAMGDTGEKMDITGKMLFDFEKEICTGCKAFVTFPSEVIAVLAEADAKANADKDGYASVERDGATLIVVSSKDFEYLGYSRMFIKSVLKMLLMDEQVGTGALESPFTPIQANYVAGLLENKKVSEEDIYIKGKIASITFPFDAEHGTATFFISDDGQNDFTFQCYSVYYLENKSWAAGNTQIKEGDEVIICGKVTNYNGTPETASKKAYIYSLNGKTKNEGGSDNPDTPKEITVAKALEIIADLEDGKTTSEEYVVKGIVTKVDEISTSYGNATFDIADNAGGTTVLKVYRAKDAEGQKITDENIVKVGDEVVVQGKLQKYVKNDVVTPEVAQNGKILTVNGQSTGITIIKADQAETPLYNLSGQRVDANYKGVVIKNGQKMIQK